MRILNISLIGALLCATTFATSVKQATVPGFLKSHPQVQELINTSPLGTQVKQNLDMAIHWLNKLLDMNFPSLEQAAKSYNRAKRQLSTMVKEALQDKKDAEGKVIIADKAQAVRTTLTRYTRLINDYKDGFEAMRRKRLKGEKDETPEVRPQTSEQVAEPEDKAPAPSEGQKIVEQAPHLMKLGAFEKEVLGDFVDDILKLIAERSDKDTLQEELKDVVNNATDLETARNGILSFEAKLQTAKQEPKPKIVGRVLSAVLYQNQCCKKTISPNDAPSCEETKKINPQFDTSNICKLRRERLGF